MGTNRNINEGLGDDKVVVVVVVVGDSYIQIRASSSEGGLSKYTGIVGGRMMGTGLICIIGNLELIEIAAETNEIEKPRKQRERLIRYTGSR